MSKIVRYIFPLPVKIIRLHGIGFISRRHVLTSGKMRVYANDMLWVQKLFHPGGCVKSAENEGPHISGQRRKQSVLFSGWESKCPWISSSSRTVNLDGLSACSNECPIFLYVPSVYCWLDFVRTVLSPSTKSDWAYLSENSTYQRNTGFISFGANVVVFYGYPQLRPV